MNLKFLLFAFMIFFSSAKAQNEFITIWKPSNPTIGNLNTTSTQIKFPGIGTNYTIYWEEVGYLSHNGTLSNITSTAGNPVLINFGTPQNPTASNATYRVKVSNGSGIFSQIKFLHNNIVVGDSGKIIDLTQWGNVVWTSMANAFYGCGKLDITATDIPNLSGVLDFSLMFASCESLIGNSSFNLWNMSSAINLAGMFSSARIFNAPIGNWNIENVTNINSMFSLTINFNQPIGNWNTSKIITMQNVFDGAIAFNQFIGNWDTSKVTNMSSMFQGANFNQPIGNWDTSKVTNMFRMFNTAINFNQDIGNWNTGNVLDMQQMFQYARDFNQPIGNWDTSKVTNTQYMFYNAKNFNQPIGNWNVSNVTTMYYMFSYAINFNQPIGNWNTSNVTNMGNMFERTNFNHPIGNWNTSKVTWMDSMFSYATSFNQPIGNWDTSKVIYMNNMFNNATNFNQDIGNWSLINLSFLSGMFKNSGVSCINYDKILIGWKNNTSTPSNKNLGDVAPLKYSANSVTARNTLVNSKGWTITGDIYDATCAPPLATSETTAKEDFILYPNPVKNVLYLKSEKKMDDIKIYTMDGKMVKDIKHADTSIDVSDLAKGNYIIKMMIEIRTEKFIKE
ncbi:Por secretion system C-terminal sorting domain-containing protein [Chryseobacterium soldanellicola]|uniref:Por secretion system C-terminal sorting domain-containing protein n=1 Tax=Chryseobacterium soldanellicola TaxID=311333 RepID=A0A1H1DZ22_9FLAO|nr:BspA family leucine-rich repeat surface protein [Chryseobacterium soldanellicola]SDQ81509.1 Por secretion system C-terminal sorting domain-containing protein [Chryseobacterium soldanellicola]